MIPIEGSRLATGVTPLVPIQNEQKNSGRGSAGTVLYTQSNAYVLLLDILKQATEIC